MENRYTESFQILVDEAHSKEHSVRWRQAVNDLRRVHNDLPDVAIMAAQKLPASNPELLARRLANAAPREIAGVGKEKLSDVEFATVVRRTHRSISMQESAEQIITEKEGIKSAGDFLSLKAAVNTKTQPSAGLVAIETLNRQGIDARRLLGQMKPAELKAISVGAFDRIEEESKGKLTAALEADVQTSMGAAVERTTVPSMRPPRTQFSPPARQATFGRKVAMVQALHHQQGVGF